MLNSFTGMGRMTKDPELKQTSGGTSYVRFSLAVPRDWNKDETDFLDCIAWRKTAEIICGHVQKGDRLIIQGTVQTSMSGTGDNKRKYTEIVVNNIGFVENSNTRQKEEPAEPTAAPETVAAIPEIDPGALLSDENLLPFDVNTDESMLPFDVN